MIKFSHQAASKLLLALGNCAGEVEGEITVLELDADAQEKIEMLICHSPMVGEVIVYSMTGEIDYSDEFVN